MVARHRDEVEFRHVGGAIGEDVRDNPHRGGRRIDVGVADHELLQNVVLNGSGKRRRRHALLFGGHDEQRQDRHHRAVHRHRNRHPVERNITEQQRHVGNGIDGDTGHADIIGDKRIVGIITAMRRQVEGHGQPHLAGGKVAPVEGVRFLGRRKAGILPDRPGAGGIHGGVGTTKIGGDPRTGRRRHRLGCRVGRGQRHDINALVGGARRRQAQRLRGAARRQRKDGEIRQAHDAPSRAVQKVRQGRDPVRRRCQLAGFQEASGTGRHGHHAAANDPVRPCRLDPRDVIGIQADRGQSGDVEQAAKRAFIGIRAFAPQNQQPWRRGGGGTAQRLDNGGRTADVGMGGKTIGNHPGKRLQRHTENLVITPAKTRLTRAGRRVRPGFDHPAFQRRAEAAGGFDLLKPPPAGLGKPFGAAFDEG